MSPNNELPGGQPTRDSVSKVSERPWSISQDLTEKFELDNDATTNNFDAPAQPLVSNDVPIPAGILRAANRARIGPLNVEDEEKALPQQTGIGEDFSILDIAFEQRQHAQEALIDIEAERDHAQHFGSGWDLEAGNHQDRWASSNLATLEEGEKLEATPSRSRWSARRSMPVRAYSNNSVRLSRTYSSSSVRRDITALPASSRNDAVLYRSLNNFNLGEPSRTGGRPLSEIPPEADYVGIFDDPQETDTELSTTNTRSSMHKSAAEADDGYVQKARKATLARLCMRDRNESVIGPAVQKVKQGATDLARRNSLLDVYDKAKIRGEQLQRKRWVQLTFEWTCYLLILCFIYFVLVGRPIWNGAVWWLYWVVNNKFTVAGTWSVTIGMAMFYAYAPLLILFEKEPPMPDESSRAEATPNQDVESTALLIPCYKAAQLIGPTLAAALKIFPAKNIFVIANGNSPTPLDNTEEICQQYGVNHVWSPVGSKIVAQYVGCYSAKGFKNVLLIDDDCALPPNFPIVSDRLTDKIKCIGYTIKSVGPAENKRGTLCQQAQDLEYKISGLQRAFAGKVGSATFPHGAISIWDTKFLIDTFRTHPGFSVSEDWFFGHTARKLGSRVTMCSAVFVETETPTSIFFSSGSRGGFGEMTIFSQRFYRWNFFFVNGMFYNMAYILCSWKLGFWEIGAKIFVFQEVYETLLYLLAPFVLPISLIVRPVFCIYLLIATVGMYYINVTIFNEVHLRRRNERVGWVAVYIYYTPYKIILTFVNVFSCYYSLYKYAKYFAKRHPKIIEDEKAVEVVLRLEESAPKKTEQGLGRRLTVTAVGSRLSYVATRNSRVSRNSRISRNSRVSRNSRASDGSISIAIGDSVARPPLAHLNSRSSRRTTTMYDHRLTPGSDRLVNPFADLARTDTIDFADEDKSVLSKET